MPTKNPTALIILDGFGYRTATEYNAIAHAQKPNLIQWFSHYPHTLLRASGTAVGLPDGVMGNSEVGHLTIGTGRIIEQPLTILNRAITDHSLYAHPILNECLENSKQNSTKLHVFGLLSDGNVHSSIQHLFAFLEIIAQHHIPQVYIHPFLDGRDVPPQSASTYIAQLEKVIANLGCGKIGSLHGRFYAMDRDHNWERTQESYNILTNVQPHLFTNPHDVINYYYKKQITDEFIPPTQLDSSSTIENGDTILFFNIRADRARQLTTCFVDPHFDAFARKELIIPAFITPVAYSKHLPNIHLYPTPPIKHTLKEIVSAHHYRIFSIAETEKYAHITYFFSGSQEEPFPTETCTLILSRDTKNYVDYPEMSAPDITRAIVESCTTDINDFYLINYANADMVGHSGNFEATVKAIECLDEQLGILYEIFIKQHNGTLYITADHGKAEDMYNPIGKHLNTSHTTNPVPFLMIRNDLYSIAHKSLPLNELADIAPFILQNMGLPIPQEMKR